jgi:hypothetical protein
MKPYIQHPNLLFTDDGHRYTWKGVDQRSVTGVLSSVATKNKKGEWVPLADNRFCKDKTAADFGEALHKAAALTLMGEEVDCPEELLPWYKQFLRWRHEFRFLRPLYDPNGVPLIEYPMYHPVYGYVGTGDLYAEAVEPCPRIWKNTVWVVDWKSSTQEANYWPAQTAGYADLLKGVFPDLVGGRKIIRASVRFESDRYFPVTRVNNPEDFAKFHSALNLLKG